MAEIHQDEEDAKLHAILETALETAFTYCSRLFTEPVKQRLCRQQAEALIVQYGVVFLAINDWIWCITAAIILLCLVVVFRQETMSALSSFASLLSTLLCKLVLLLVSPIFALLKQVRDRLARPQQLLDESRERLRAEESRSEKLESDLRDVQRALQCSEKLNSALDELSCSLKKEVKRLKDLLSAEKEKNRVEGAA